MKAMKVLVAVDGSPYTHRMLAYIAAHDEWLGNHHDYHVLHVALAVPHRAAAFVGTDAVRRFHEDDAETVLRPIRQFFEQQRIPATYHWKIGHPSNVIAEEAERGRYDLVMMGSHGHGELASVVLGSTATQVLARCKTPVLLVR
jgi:nucleotide-binding universal stress UspA family protein